MQGCRFLVCNILPSNDLFNTKYISKTTSSMPQIRLAISTMLRARSGDCCILLGMKCSSWCVVNQGTSKRAPCCPLGNLLQPTVREANCMAARKLTYSLDCTHGYLILFPQFPNKMYDIIIGHINSVVKLLALVL